MIYHGRQMRRGASILLALILGAGPLAPAFTAGADAGLPACCRRNGAHRCAMKIAAKRMESRAPAFGTSGVCPAYRNAVLAVLTPAHAMAVTRAPIAERTDARAGFSPVNSVAPLAPGRSHAGRGPPQSNVL